MRQFFKNASIALSFARREFRGGLRGFYIFLACIALGTGSIAAVNSVSSAITEAIAQQGQDLLAGDIRVQLRNREASEAERTYLNSLGEVAVSTGLRSMARTQDSSEQTLVEVKGVDQNYPLFGKFESSPNQPIEQSLKADGATFGGLAAPILFDRLGLKQGDIILLGNTQIKLNGAIETEPDAISDGFAFAPRLLISREAILASGLVQIGSLVEHSYKLRLNDQSSRGTIEAKANEQFHNAGWSIRTSDRAAPSLTTNVERFSQFLTLVGLTALVVGGVGVANAVRSYLDGKRKTIASLKCLGAPGSVITMTYLIQIGFIGAIGILAGLALGIIIPNISIYFLKGFLPVPDHFTIYPTALGLAALFGALTTFAFATLPLGRARTVPATALLRDQVSSRYNAPPRAYLVAAILLMLALAGLALISAQERFVAVIFLGAICCAFAVLFLVSLGVKYLARKSPRVQSTSLRLAIGNIHRPGALTSSVIMSLGLGLTLLVTLAVIDGNLRNQLSSTLPDRAPNFFFLDVQTNQVEQFKEVLRREAPGGKLFEVPMLRGRVTELNGVDTSKLDIPSSGRWVLRGDRGITYTKRQPENSTLTAGEWWPEDYDGEPLVSFAAEEAGELGLKLGDTVTVNVLGRNISARISSLRDVEWESLSINFVMIFSPNTFRGAPHSWLSTLTDPTATPEDEGRILRAVTREFPTVTTARVKDALDVVNTLTGQLATAVRAVASIALIASVLVLAGALAAGNRARTHDAVVLKTLGATRKTLVRSFCLEYLLLGLSTAVFALGAGSLAAWFVVSRIMKLPAIFLPEVAGITVVIALVVTVGIGLMGTWRILGLTVAPVLREPDE
jgi:putative ABC transport system permease protein